MSSPKHFARATLVVCLLALTAAMMGCPQQSDGTAKVLTVLAWDASPAKADVPVEDIEELWITVTKITMGPTSVDDEETDGEEASEETKAHLVVFDAADSAPVEVNIKDLSGVSALISASEIPAGVYNQIRLYVEDPVMVLADPAKAEYTNIQLTANSRLFISGSFEVPEGDVVIQLDFEGVKIVQQGNGNYTWTPQLRANVDVSVVQTTTSGTIASGSLTADTFTLTLVNGEVSVNYGGADIYDTDGVTLLDGSYLAEGQVVEVIGTLTGDQLVAASVRIVS